MKQTSWAFDIGGTNLRIGLFDETSLLKMERLRWSGKSVESDLNDIRKIVDICTRSWGVPEKGGVSIAAMLSVSQDIVLSWPNRPWWIGVDIKKTFSLIIPIPFNFDDDTASALLGEWTYGAAKGYQHVIMITVGTGIGGGLMYKGQLIRGGNGWAGDIGHIQIDLNGPLCTCGQSGCLQALASGEALARLVSATERGKKITNDTELWNAIKENKEWTRKAVRTICHYIGIGIANSIKFFDPEVIIIGGGISQVVPFFLEECEIAVRKIMGTHPAKDILLKSAVLGDNAGIYGAFILSNNNKW